jgi:hypothetical protein
MRKGQKLATGVGVGSMSAKSKVRVISSIEVLRPCIREHARRAKSSRNTQYADVRASRKALRLTADRTTLGSVAMAADSVFDMVGALLQAVVMSVGRRLR